MSDSESSEPDSTTVSGIEDVASEDSGAKNVSIVDVQEKSKKKKNQSFPIACIVLLEFVLPICYLFNSISTQSIMGLINIVILIANVIISNMTRTKTIGYKIILTIELFYNIALLICISVFSYQDDAKENETLKLLGLDFDNTVVSTPVLSIVMSSIAIVLEIISFVLLSKTRQEDMIEKRRKFYGSMGWMFTADLLWCFCIAYVGAANTSYLYAPILLYFAYISVTMGLVGKPLVPHWIHYIVNGYSTIYSLYLFFQVSYIGSKYSLSEYINFQKISKESLDGVMLAFNVIQIWLSVQLLFAFATHSEPQRIPKFLTSISDVTLVLSFAGVLIYAVFYPCYISVLWTIVVFFASFFGLKAARKVFFRLITVIYNITFIIIYATNVDFYPYDKIPKNQKDRLEEIGLYKFIGDFTFTILGFFLAAILAQIGRIVHAPQEEESDVGPIIVVAKQKVGKRPAFVDEGDEEEQGGKFKKFVEKSKEFIKKGTIFLMKYASVGAVIVLSLTYAYAPNEICFHIVFLIALIMSVIGLYKKFAFHFIKLICGLVLISASFFYTNKSDFDDDKYSWINKTGIGVPDGETLTGYLWPHMVIFFLCVIITNMDEVSLKFPSKVVTFFFWVVCILHLLYVYLYGPNIFSVTYIIGGVALFACQVLDLYLGMKILTIFSGLSVSIHQLVLLFSEYDDLRNWFQAVIPTTIIDIRNPAEASGETVLLAITLFIISLTYQNTKPKNEEKSQYIVGVGEELKAAVRSFYFYIAWIFIFFFSICNDYPTIIKAVLSCIFLLGSKIAKFFNKVVKVMLLFMLVFLTAQTVFEVFPEILENHEKWSQYTGLFFGKVGYSRSERNVSMTWQLLFILISIVNIIASNAQPTTPEFDSCLPMRIYRAFYTMLHDFLTVFVDISLCISTLYNPTIFGYLSFIVLIIVQFKPSVLQKGAILITILFNLSFLFQYIIWLGLPDGQFEFAGFDNEWGDFLSIRNIETSALLTNCLSAFVLTFYLQFRSLVLSKDMAFDELPETLKAIIKFLVSNIFEICESIAIGVSILIPTFDGVFFFLLIGLLFFATLLFDFDPHKTVSIHLWGMFLVILARMLSRIPYFTDNDLGEIISDGFGLPFRGHSNTEYIWIILFALESLLIHIMDTDMYKQCRKDSMQRLAYRFVRVRQLKLISRLNQDIIENIQEKKIDEIKKVGESVGQHVIKQKGEKQQDVETKRIFAEDAEEEEESTKEEEEEQETTFFDKLRSAWSWIFDRLFSPFIGAALEIICKTIPLNSEAGVNVLTLNSIHSILRREAGVIRSNGVFTLTPTEREFLEKLPPSFSRQISCITDLLGPQPIKKEQYFEMFIRYIGLLIRRLAFPALVLTSVVYLYLKPYIFSLVIFMYIMVFFTGAEIYGKPIIYRVFYLILVLMLCFRNLSTVNMIKDPIGDYMNSVDFTNSNVNFPSLLGINPYDSSAIEIFIFLFGIWFIVDELHNAVVFPPNYYQQVKFGGNNKLEGFPDKYYYNFDNVEKILGLSIKVTPGIFDQIKASTNKLRIQESSNYLYAIIFDAIGFIVMLFGVNGWTKTVNNNSASDVTTSFEFTYLLIFSLVFSAVFIIIIFLFRMSNNFFILYIVNTIQCFFILIFAFFICNDPFNSGLQFYLFVKIISVLIVYQDTYLGKFVANINSPDVEKDGNYIYWMNRFIRFCPFVFELYTLIMWMSKRTKVPLKEYIIIQDLKGQLENQMVLNYKEKQDMKKKKEKEQHIYIIGIVLIVILILLLFGPLCFMVNGNDATRNNPLLSSILEIGFTSTGNIYKAGGTISTITNSVHNKLASSGASDLRKFKVAQSENIYVVTFPLTSSISPESIEGFNITSLSSAVPYVRITNTYSYTTTSANTRTTTIQNNGDELDDDQMDEFSLAAKYQNATYNELINVPLGFYTPSDSNAYLSSTSTTIGIKFVNVSVSEDDSLIIAKINATVPSDANFLSNASVTLFVWSDEVASDNIAGSILSSSGGIIGIYILIVITFGEVIREATLGQYEDLWIERMKYPNNLYRYILAIEAFRSVGAMDKEFEMCEKFILIARSKEQCIQITDQPEKKKEDDE